MRLLFGEPEVEVPVWYCTCKVSPHGKFYCGVCGQTAQRGVAIFDNPMANGPRCEECGAEPLNHLDSCTGSIA